MRGTALCLAVLALFAVATGGALATANTPPLVAAGVDQTVTPGSTVYLDANGSTDPDGEITSVEWTIETPSGTTQTPDCGTCRQTQFTASATGQYTVTLSVTDDDGATRSDTLYVTVESREGPSVSLSAPTTAVENNENTFTANADAANASLESISWLVDGDVVAQQSVSGSDATDSLTRSFDTPEPVEVSVVVYDTLGYRGEASQTVDVAPDTVNQGSGCEDGDAWEGLCNGGADATITTDGQTYLLNTNGEEGYQTVQNGQIVTVQPTTSQYISQQNGRLVVESSVSITTAFENTNTGLAEQVTSSFSANRSNRNDGDLGEIDRENNADGTSFGLVEPTEEALSTAGIEIPGSDTNSGGGNDRGDTEDDESNNDGGFLGNILGSGGNDSGDGGGGNDGGDGGGDNDGGGSGGLLGGLI